VANATLHSPSANTGLSGLGILLSTAIHAARPFSLAHRHTRPDTGHLVEDTGPAIGLWFRPAALYVVLKGIGTIQEEKPFSNMCT
jgi:hypothetical protein